MDQLMIRLRTLMIGVALLAIHLSGFRMLFSTDLDVPQQFVPMLWTGIGIFPFVETLLVAMFASRRGFARHYATFSAIVACLVAAGVGFAPNRFAAYVTFSEPLLEQWISSHRWLDQTILDFVTILFLFVLFSVPAMLISLAFLLLPRRPKRNSDAQAATKLAQTPAV